jgi:hypothetical protein
MLTEQLKSGVSPALSRNGKEMFPSPIASFSSMRVRLTLRWKEKTRHILSSQEL